MIRIDNDNIGKYLEKLIKEKYGTARRFCGAYLKKNGEADTGDNLKNLENRISQIKKGNKGIQIDDLPVFSELLDVTFEQILSGGHDEEQPEKYVVERQNNYYIAQSHNENQWQAYINKKEKPVLYADEYGKNILDYALEFENYELIKFLIDNEYVWFVNENEKMTEHLGFGAGTSIERCDFSKNELGIYTRMGDENDLCCLGCSEKMQERFRVKIISMALENNDIEMLEKMKAREIPELYWNTNRFDKKMSENNSQLDGQLILNIINSNEEVMEYFTESFETEGFGNRKGKNTFVFPYMTQLLDCMIDNDCKYTRTALEKALQHNNNVSMKLHQMLAGFEEAYVEYFGEQQYYDDDEIQELIRKKEREKFQKDKKDYVKLQMRNLAQNYNNESIIDILCWFSPLFNDELVTNIVKVNSKTEDKEIRGLINQINNKYKEILKLCKE